MDLVNHLSDRMLFAVPKKGRLQQASLDLLSGSDVLFKRENRLDIALVKNLPIALIFLPAADIPTFVGEGRVDLGITGLDQVAEYEALLPRGEVSNVEQVMDLGFGKCKLQVQVPEKGEIQNAKDLVGKNIVTSFTALTEDYFARLENGRSRKDSINDTISRAPKLKTRVKYIGGSVEAACALGVANGIVDLVESGETMRAAGLCAIDTVIESSAILIKSKTTSNQKLVDLLTSRIRGVIQAKKYVLCTYNIQRSRLPEAKTITPGKRAPTITSLDEPEWVAVQAMVTKQDIASVMDRLEEISAADILVTELINSRTSP